MPVVADIWCGPAGHKTAAAGRAIADALSAQIESLEQAYSDGTVTS